MTEGRGAVWSNEVAGIERDGGPVQPAGPCGRTAKPWKPATSAELVAMAHELDDGTPDGEFLGDVLRDVAHLADDPAPLLDTIAELPPPRRGWLKRAIWGLG